MNLIFLMQGLPSAHPVMIFNISNYWKADWYAAHYWMTTPFCLHWDYSHLLAFCGLYWKVIIAHYMPFKKLSYFCPILLYQFDLSVPLIQTVPSSTVKTCIQLKFLHSLKCTKSILTMQNKLCFLNKFSLIFIILYQFLYQNFAFLIGLAKFPNMHSSKCSDLIFW